MSTSDEDTATKRTGVPRFFRIWGAVLEFASFECLLTRCRLPNGGGVILLRSLLAALIIYFLALGLHNLLDSTRTWSFSGAEFKSQVRETLHWYGAIFAAVYAGLYTRFASQWTYLANFYNQIKATESGTWVKNSNSLAEWKAGFIEDAEDLHLATKPLFASVIRAWVDDGKVKELFEKYAPGGEPRLSALMRRVQAAWQQTTERR